MQVYAKPLGTILYRLLDNLQEHSFVYVNLILRIFWTATYLDIPDSIGSIDEFKTWMECHYRVICVDLGELENVSYYESENRDEIDANPAW
mmetsp:Transcript_13493/g.2126  ORF Transcript_13493/g.2126 Transcript_13493/m.2126 type:complete len:91 (-) Transcript_13493:2888-3160(-)